MDSIAKILELRSQYKNTQALPAEFRKLVFDTIYKHLSGEEICGEYKTQSELLKAMGLSPDIFTKHWKMYSPDMKYRQQSFDADLNLPFNHAEVESNAIFRAMLHHMITCSDIYTDTFVDVFGKLGLIPALCAKGYKKQIVYSGDCINLELFKEALKRPASLYKLIKGVQHSIDIKTFSEKKKYIHKLISLYIVRVWLIKLRCNNEIDGNLEEFAKEYIIANCFMPEYWLYAKHVVEDGEVTERLNGMKISHRQIDAFLSMTKEDFVKLSELYRRLEFRTEGEGIGENAFLYIDPPKFIREFSRFKFDENKYINMAKILLYHKGNWIFAWKNYIEKYNKSKKSSELFTKDMKEKLKFGLREVLEVFKEINRQKKLQVFKYRNDNRNEPNSIAFITNIPVETISEEDFAKKYKLELKNNGRLIIEEFEEFYKRSGRFLAQYYVE